MATTEHQSKEYSKALKREYNGFVLDLPLFISELDSSISNLLGSKLSFFCKFTPPSNLHVNSNDIVVATPQDYYNEEQLKQLALIIDKIRGLSELKLCRYFEISIDIKSHDILAGLDYFLLDSNSSSYFQNKEVVEDKQTNSHDQKHLRESNSKHIETILQQVFDENIKNKISTIHDLMDHFIHRTQELIANSKVRLEEKSININNVLSEIQNKVILREKKVKNLNNLAWKILEHYSDVGDELLESELSESNTASAFKPTNDEYHTEILTLDEALKRRISHGGFGLPEDFGNPQKLLQLGESPGAPHNMDAVKNDHLKYRGSSASHFKVVNQSKSSLWDPIQKKIYSMHDLYHNYDNKYKETIHPATNKLLLIQNRDEMPFKRETSLIHRNRKVKKYDPIIEYGRHSIQAKILKNHKIDFKDHYPTVFSYLGRPIPELNHHDPPHITRRAIIDSIKLSMSTDASRNIVWQSYGRPLPPRHIQESDKLESSKLECCSPLEHTYADSQIVGADVYYVLV
ncbi:hypothetical protein cand_036540 [Cryptosporidium andersoni]|uniref:Uncharacterized protein n=1 Tax=Cryptosporidium andersoni TaxID=117008 RepID=A0A1J4MV47_9CRYT|nr:hypothetical protein cand_036540 [Cryptosporidium andersoni]